ncbi:MAG: NAD-dependent epimerase/dehydratase family protein [Thermoleophilia bacterium]
MLTGSGGWVGRCALDLLARASDHREVVVATSHPRTVVTDSGAWPAVAMSSLPTLERGPQTLLLHCGFPTQDQVDVLGEDAYTDAIRRLRSTMIETIDSLGSVDMVYLSSGAATSVEGGRDVADRTRLYGQAKLDDELAFRDGIAAADGRLCVVRAFALAGPYMTKPEAYALGGMIAEATSDGRITVRAARPVRRSYMLIDDMLRIALQAVGALGSGGQVTFETGGEVVEMDDLAARVLGVLGKDPTAVSRPALDASAVPDDYFGSTVVMDSLARTAGVVPIALDDQIGITAEWLLRSVR